MRTCARCGQKFETHRGYLCPNCRARRDCQYKDQQRRSGELTARDRQVLELIYDGSSNAEIAGALLLKEGTVKTYISYLFDKLGADSRCELMARRIRDLEQQVRQLLQGRVA